MSLGKSGARQIGTQEGVAYWKLPARSVPGRILFALSAGLHRWFLFAWPRQSLVYMSLLRGVWRGLESRELDI
jgi:hypothetical protein